MTPTVTTPSRKTIILVGLVGCFLTSVAGVTGSMLISGWSASGGALEWVKRLALGYPCACLVVWGLFPLLVPWLTQRLEANGDPQAL
jgi:phosphotransferase system  glucose/maltose/N-acetylglucosamine-specific IIC component